MPPFLLSLFGLIPQILDRVLPGDSPDDRAKKLEIQAELQKAVHELSLGQIEVNKAEASNVNRRWPTWRELVGYTCALAFMYHFVIQQVLAFLFSALGHHVQLPNLEISELMTVLMGMLGLGALQIGEHGVNSIYNSPRGEMPVDNKKPSNEVNHGGRIVDGIWTTD